MKYTLTRYDLQKHLSNQVRFLKNSSDAYDAGFEDEAQRLATTIRVLMHDTKRSTSLLTHLDCKQRIFFVSSTSQYIPTNLAPYLAFLVLRTTVGHGGEYIPLCRTDLQTPNKWLRFDDWWNEIVIDDKKSIFTRKDIILNISNKDGGAHIDSKLDTDYAELTRNNSIGWEYLDNGVRKPFDNNPAYAVVRQVVHEVLLSFDWFFAEKSYQRVGSQRTFMVAFIGEKRYLYEKTKDCIADKLFIDDRVERREIRKLYTDKIRFGNGQTGMRNIIIG